MRLKIGPRVPKCDRAGKEGRQFVEWEVLLGGRDGRECFDKECSLIGGEVYSLNFCVLCCALPVRKMKGQEGR